MNLIDLIKRKFTAKTFVDPNDAFFPNRHERRARGIKIPVGLLPTGVEGVEQVSFDLRYVLRHWDQASAYLRTRRRQKARARIRRLLSRQGRA